MATKPRIDSAADKRLDLNVHKLLLAWKDVLKDREKNAAPSHDTKSRRGSGPRCSHGK
ncbi:MAG: hypothetical protein WAW06_01095 [bacterium]